MPDLHTSELERLIMLAMLRLGTDAYGASIRAELKQRVGRSVTISTIYLTLLRLEERGMVSSCFGDPTPVRGGKAKRLFQVEPLGLKALRAADSVWQRMRDGLDPVLGRA